MVGSERRKPRIRCSHWRELLLASTAAIAVFAPGVQAQEAGTRAIVEIGTLGGEWSRAYALDERTRMVGIAETDRPDRVYLGYLWERASGLIEYDSFGGLRSKTRSINEFGEIAGWASTDVDPGGFRATLWNMQGEMFDLGTLGGSRSKARWLNDRGQVVGHAHNADEIMRPFVWTPKTGMVDLGTFGGSEGEAYSINNRGQIAGRAFNEQEQNRAFFYDPDTGMENLGTFGGDASVAYAMNEYGQVVGDALDSSGRRRAFLWQPGGQMRDLGTLGGDASLARGINNNGVVVGRSQDSKGEWKAFVWTESEGMIDMNSLIDPALGWTLIEGRPINDLGYMGGFGDHDGKSRAFLLTPPLTLSEPDPGIAGTRNTWTIRGLLPQSSAFLAYALKTGDRKIPGCPAVSLDLVNPRAFGPFPTENGNAVVRMAVPPGAKGRKVYFQAVELATCRKTEVVQFVFK